MEESKIRALFKENVDKRLSGSYVTDIDLSIYKAGEKVMSEDKFVEVLKSVIDGKKI